MKNIQVIDVEKMVSESDADFFVIFLQTEDGKLLTWRKRSFTSIANGHNDASLFDKGEAVEQYYTALREARLETRPNLFEGGGRLDLLPLRLPK